MSQPKRSKNSSATKSSLYFPGMRAHYLWEQITLDMIEVKADNETLQNKESTNRILRAFNDANVQSIMRIYENTRGNESET